ncbi:sensor histidine kinase [Paenibacillus hamazuiensis]|uniref:sensor histidine kinase n=1 Tax=Paenibacillus hamazuiensis TaxID=2936508 RepID=UPI00200BE76F|nr:sensor histidine kinase [Paenibacillus hamazuiensis]
MNLITKMILLIFALMAPVIVIYLYSNQKSTQVVEEQINIANRNRLSHYLNVIEETMEQVSVYANIVTKDPDFAELAAGAVPANGYDYTAMVGTIERKLGLFSLSTSWMNRISVYFPALKLAVSSQTPVSYSEKDLTDRLSTGWTLRSVPVGGLTKRAFTRYFVGPSSSGAADLSKTSIVVEVNLMEDNIVSLLNSFKTKGNNDPFFYRSPGEYLLNSSSDEPTVQEIIRSYNIGENSRLKNQDIIRLHNKQYLIYLFPSEKLGWTLVDYVPLQDILAPVTGSKHLFYFTSGLLLLFGVVAAFLLYTHVQVPIRSLTQSVLQLKQGRFSARITAKQNRDFQLLVAQFNEMAAEIQHLVEKVYLGDIRAKEAVMKQLQSQINPHFLYNSLAFIVSMAKLNRTPPIVSMAHNLADYYRYTTRNDRMVTTVREELAFVTSYVEVMNCQLGKIHYETNLPDSMLDMTIPRLLIQPIVENAIVHGIEPKSEAGQIYITGADEQDILRVIVEDNGVGMTASEASELRERLQAAGEPGQSCGLWNVNQRLRYHFGEDAGLFIETVASGGLRVVLQWRVKDELPHFAKER